MNKGNNKLPNSEQSYKGKVKTHKYTNRQNQSTIIHKPTNNRKQRRTEHRFYAEIATDIKIRNPERNDT